MTKVQIARDFIRERIGQHKAPAVASSFGKDSMALLHLAREMGLELPVIFHRDPWFPEKNRFADMIIDAWKLVVYDWLPSAAGIKLNGTLETVARYQVGPSAYCDIPKNIVPRQAREKFLCGRDDILGRPKGGCLHQWDLYFIGHKDCDVDECDGPAPLRASYVPTTPAAAFPLKDWSDAEVWKYIQTYRVPVQNERYDRDTGALRPEHARWSNDYLTACVKCLDPREPGQVPCPKLDGALVPNVSGAVARFQERASYIGNSA